MYHKPLSRWSKGGVPKWLRERTANPLCAGSNPAAASITPSAHLLVSRTRTRLPAAGVVGPQAASTPLDGALTAGTGLRSIELVLLERAAWLATLHERRRVCHGAP